MIYKIFFFSNKTEILHLLPVHAHYYLSEIPEKWAKGRKLWLAALEVELTVCNHFVVAVEAGAAMELAVSELHSHSDLLRNLSLFPNCLIFKLFHYFNQCVDYFYLYLIYNFYKINFLTKPYFWLN